MLAASDLSALRSHLRVVGIPASYERREDSFGFFFAQYVPVIPSTSRATSPEVDGGLRAAPQNSSRIRRQSSGPSPRVGPVTSRLALHRALRGVQSSPPHGIQDASSSTCYSSTTGGMSKYGNRSAHRTLSRCAQKRRGARIWPRERPTDHPKAPRPPNKPAARPQRRWFRTQSSSTVCAGST